MSITLEQAKNLKPGQILYHEINHNADGSPQRWRVNGQVKVWKSDASRVQIPMKHGLYTHGYLDEHTLQLVRLTEDVIITD